MNEISDKACADLAGQFSDRDFPHMDWQYLSTETGQPWLFGITMARTLPQARAIADEYAAFLNDSQKEINRTVIETTDGEDRRGTLPLVRAWGEHGDVYATISIFVTENAVRDLYGLLP